METLSTCHLDEFPIELIKSGRLYLAYIITIRTNKTCFDEWDSSPIHKKDSKTLITEVCQDSKQDLQNLQPM